MEIKFIPVGKPAGVPAVAVSGEAGSHRVEAVTRAGVNLPLFANMTLPVALIAAGEHMQRFPGVEWVHEHDWDEN